MHGRNNNHNTDDCFELNQRKKHAKSDTSWSRKDKLSYKDLNAFVNAKVTAALNKAKTKRKERKEKVACGGGGVLNCIYTHLLNKNPDRWTDTEDRKRSAHLTSCDVPQALSSLQCQTHQGARQKGTSVFLIFNQSICM